MRTNAQSCDGLCMRSRVFITWWCVAPCRRCPNCCGVMSWPDGRGSDTTAPTAAASAGLSVRRTTALADTPPPGKGARSHGYLLQPPPSPSPRNISGHYCKRVSTHICGVFPTFWHFWTLSSPVSVVWSAERMYLFRVLSRARSFRQDTDKMPSHIKMLPSN